MSELISKSGVMVIRTMKALNGYTLSGLSITELSKAINASPANVTRYLNTLVSEDMSRKLENGRYALGIGMIQIAQTTASDLLKNRDEIDDILRRITIR